VPCVEELDDDVNGCGTAQVRVTSGADEGAEVTVPLPNGPGALSITEGDDVVLLETTSPDGRAFAVVDHQRSAGLSGAGRGLRPRAVRLRSDGLPELMLAMAALGSVGPGDQTC